MAIDARIWRYDGFVALQLHPSLRRERIEAPSRIAGLDGVPLLFYWDAEKLDRGERELLGVEALDIRRLRDEDLELLSAAPFPRLDCPDAGLYDATVADVLRWAKRNYVGREETARKADAA